MQKEATRLSSSPRTTPSNSNRAQSSIWTHMDHLPFLDQASDTALVKSGTSTASVQVPHFQFGPWAVVFSRGSNLIGARSGLLHPHNPTKSFKIQLPTHRKGFKIGSEIGRHFCFRQLSVWDNTEKRVGSPSHGKIIFRCVYPAKEGRRDSQGHANYNVFHSSWALHTVIKMFPRPLVFFSFHEQENESCQNILWAHLSPVQLHAVPQGQVFLICWCLSSEKLPVGWGSTFKQTKPPKSQQMTLWAGRHWKGA